MVALYAVVTASGTNAVLIGPSRFIDTIEDISASPTGLCTLSTFMMPALLISTFSFGYWFINEFAASYSALAILDAVAPVPTNTELFLGGSPVALCTAYAFVGI